MSDLIQDTWHDLRERRLWPVALALVLAIVAIPVLLTKSAAQAPATVPSVATTDAQAELEVTLDDGDAGSTAAGSPLGRFPVGDPFTPPAAIAAAAAGATATASLAGASASGAQGGGGSTSQPRGPGASEPAPPTTRTETETETAEYEYVADVTFWNGDRRRKVRGLRKLTMLPSQSAPVLIFMGASGGGGNAIFLVDSTLEGAGEGRCVPSSANCVYAYVGPGSEHAFSTVEGASYRIRVDEIRRVKVGARRAAASPSAQASTGLGAPARRFQLPRLADLAAVTTETTTTTTTTTPPDPGSSPARGGGR